MFNKHKQMADTMMHNEIQWQIKEKYQKLHDYYQKGQHEEVTKHASQLYLLIQQQIDAGNPATTEIADMLNGIGMIYLFMGNTTQAGPLLRQALEIRQHFEEEQTPAIAQSLNNVAGYYEVLGEYAQAEDWYQQALTMRIQLFGEVNLEVALTQNNLAQIYRTTGRYAQAAPLYQQALSTCHACLEKNHPIIATLLNNLAPSLMI
jgi:tetratricopeptide (TPR) repeat protein